MLEVRIKETDLLFETNEKVFSPSGIDRGTLAMLHFVSFDPADKVLDLGCGYGAVGILAAKLSGPEQVTMCDISEEAVRLAKKNAEQNGVGTVKIIQSDGFSNLTESDFTLILSNPPYHADFSVPKAFIEQGYRRLAQGGKLYMVTKRKDWYKNKLISVFGGVTIEELDGYFVFCAEKRERKAAKKKKENHLSRNCNVKQKGANADN